MKTYMLSRYHKRMAYAKEYLGGKCVKCNTDENLEIDHKDRQNKSFTLAKNWNINILEFNKELDKCQLLCKTCHGEKTLIDLGQQSAKNNHGTLSSYRYCKCELCKKAKSDNSREYRLKKLGRFP